MGEVPTRTPRIDPVLKELLLTFVNKGTGGDANASERFGLEPSRLTGMPR
jgi:hypothetical protein